MASIKYKPYRIPLDVHENIEKKKTILEGFAQKMFGKHVRISKTNIMRYAFGKTWYGIQDDEIKNLVKRKKKVRREIIC
jgi:hypothetical protein